MPDTIIQSPIFIWTGNGSAEEILSFESHIHVHEDSSMSVTENITVHAENNKINRGIYRDFPH